MKERSQHWPSCDGRREVLNTPRGPVGYLDAGSGPPILYFHGTGAGNDLALRMERSLVEQGFRLIIPNRPGYGETPIECGETTSDAVWLATQILDHLQIDRVGVLGTSGGGSPALAFASLCGARTAALVLQCAQSHRWDSAQWLPTGKGWLLPLLRPPWMRRVVLFGYHLHNRNLAWTPRSYFRELTGPRYAELSEDPAARELVDIMIEAVIACYAQPVGPDNDLQILLSESILAKETVACPTLIVHDRFDPVVPFAHAQWAASQIPNATICEVHSGGHLVWVGRDASMMLQQRCAFLRQHVPG